MGMVFQNFGLIPHLNVIENIAFPLKIQNFNKDTCFEKAKKVIELVGLKAEKKIIHHNYQAASNNELVLHVH